MARDRAVVGLARHDKSLFANYSWQDEPEPEGFDLSERNLPPTHRFNVGMSYNGPG